MANDVTFSAQGRVSAGRFKSGGWASGSGVLNGSGFGSNSNFSPLHFIDFIGLSTGDSWATASDGGTEIDDGDFSQEVSMNDGAVGEGCLLHDFQRSASDEWFTHFAVTVPSLQECTVFKHVKIAHIEGTQTEVAQYKSTFFLTDQYSGSGSKVYSALWRDEANLADSYYTAYESRPEDGHVDDITTPGDTIFLNIYDEQWHSNFAQAQLNSADGVADGLYRDWWDGDYKITKTDLDMGDPATFQWSEIQFNPGCSNGYSDSGRWHVKHDRLVVIQGLAWAAFGNASMFSECTDLVVVDPISWSDGQIDFNTHGVIPSGHKWMYVMDTAGNLVSSSGLTNFSVN